MTLSLNMEELKMSKNSFNDCRYLHLDIDPDMNISVSIAVKLEDEEVTVNAFLLDQATGDMDCIGSTSKTYHDFGIEVKDIVA